jgi:hypothetical protein
MTFTRAPVEAESSVTESPQFATQMWVPPEVMLPGPLNLQPISLTPESGRTGVADGETWEALFPVAPTADESIRMRSGRTNASWVRRGRTPFVLEWHVRTLHARRS